MFGSAGKSPAVNGGMRGGFRGGDDEEDEDEEGGASFKRDAISLDQVSGYLGNQQHGVDGHLRLDGLRHSRYFVQAASELFVI